MRTIYTYSWAVGKPADNHWLVDSPGLLGLTKYEPLVCITLTKVVTAPAAKIHEIPGVPTASVNPVITHLTKKN